jgi:hypothetical protein
MTTTFTPEQKQEIKEIVHEALSEFFRGYGMTAKNVIITAAILIASITAIFGGIKTLFAWLGFTILRS